MHTEANFQRNTDFGADYFVFYIYPNIFH